MTIRNAMILSTLLSLSLYACGGEEDSAAEEETSEEVPAAETAPAETAEAEEAPAAEPEAPAAESEVNPPAEGETTTLLSLREGFAANPEAWTGQTVTVRAQFMNATSVGGSLNNVSLVVSEEDYAEDRLAHSMMCVFGDDAPESVDMTQYDEIVVRGTVVERFGRAGLDDCEIVTE